MPVPAIPQQFAAGDYAAVGMAGDTDHWQTFAAWGILGKTQSALEGLRQWDTPESRFYQAVACWIAGDDDQAKHRLSTLADPHAQNLLALLNKPKIHVLSHLAADRQPPWDVLTSVARDAKFELRNISFHPDDLPNAPYADVRRFYDARFPPDFYACIMAEWHLLPPNLRDLPCPLLGGTADYDMLAQAAHPWLHVFDELLVGSQSEYHDVKGLVRAPVSSFVKWQGLGDTMPPIPDAPREHDLFFSGTTLHPYHPEKAKRLREVLSLDGIQPYLVNGFLSLEEYYRLLGKAKVCFTSVRFPACPPARGIEALGMGCAVTVQQGCVMGLYVGEDEGVVTYSDAEGDFPRQIRRLVQNWDVFEARARRGGEIIRREFALPTVASQLFRFFTFLAARPRDLSQRTPLPALHQKMTAMRLGWIVRDPKIQRERVMANLNAYTQILEKGPDLQAFNDAARELTLEYGAKQAMDPNAKTLPTEMLQGAFTLFRTALAAFPDSLVLRFNFIRTGLYFGTEAEKAEARTLLRETLCRPADRWQVDAMDDVFPWDFFPDNFNYRAYFDLITQQAAHGADSLAGFVALILASLHYHQARNASDSAPDIAALAEAVRLDPAFPVYRLHYAQALLKHGQAGDLIEAGKCLHMLARGSVVWMEAFALLKPLHEKRIYLADDFEALARAAHNAHASVSSGSDGWSMDESSLSGQEGAGVPRNATITRAPRAADRPPYRVSAIVPLYNAELFLHELLEDLEAQSIADELEIVLCNTGSPQNEDAIVAEFQARYDNIVYIRTAHRENAAQAQNRCIAEATGRYLTLACADDRHRPDALEIMARALDERADVGLVYANSLITKFPNETFARNRAHSVLRWPDFSLRQLLQYSCFGPQPMWRRDLHAAHGVFAPELKIANDYDLFSRFAWHAGAHHIPEALGLYMEGGNGSRNPQATIRETQQVARRYRTAIPLEQIYPALAQHPDDNEARAACLLDFGNSLMGSASPDNEMTQQCYLQAETLLGAHPVVMNNRGVIACVLGEREQGIAWLQTLANAGDVAARHNLSEVYRPSGPRPRFQLGGLLHSVLEKMPPLIPPEALRQPLDAAQREKSRLFASRATAPVHNSDRPAGLSFIIVTAGQREELLQRVKRSIHRQNLPAYEILIVGVHREESDCRYLPAVSAARNCKRGAMRNLGMDAAQYDTLVFLDDDILLVPDWRDAFASGPQEFDILTMRLRVPDGSRYWDYVMEDGNGQQRILRDDETDSRVFATGGAMVMKAYVGDTVRWDAQQTEYEDLDISRRCQAAGFTITHNVRCLAFHADATYTSVGRWTLRRANGRTQRWIEELKTLSCLELFAEGERLLNRDRTAEAADCFRYGLLHFPDYTAFDYALAGIEAKTGGSLPDVFWFPQEDPAYTDVLAFSALTPDALTPNPSSKNRRGENAAGDSFLSPLQDDKGLQRTHQVINHSSPVPVQDEQGKEKERYVYNGSLPSPVLGRGVGGEGNLETTALYRAPAYDLTWNSGDYAQETLPWMMALEATGATLAARCFTAREQEARVTVAAQARLLAASERIFQPGAIHISSLFPPCFRRELQAERNIGRVLFGTETLPPDWLEACRTMDTLWVATTLQREALLCAGIAPERVTIVPTPLHTACYDPTLSPLPIPGARGFNFLSVFDWRLSAGWDALLRAYVREFNNQDDVALILRPCPTRGETTPQMTERAVQCIQQARRGDMATMPTVLIHDAEVPMEQQPNLFRAADAFVATSRLEATGYPLLEAMAMAMPVIATPVGPAAGFLTVQNGFPVEMSSAAAPMAACKETPGLRGGRWQEPNEAHLRQQLRQVFARRSEAKTRGEQARRDVQERHDYRQVAEVLRTEIARLRERTQVAAGGITLDVLLN